MARTTNLSLSQGDTGLDTRKVAGETKAERKPRNRKRTRNASTLRRINATARERQAAWLATGQPTTTYQLTRELDGLYGEHRDDQAGTLTDPYRGRTSKVGKGA